MGTLEESSVSKLRSESTRVIIQLFSFSIVFFGQSGDCRVPAYTAFESKLDRFDAPVVINICESICITDCPSKFKYTESNFILFIAGDIHIAFDSSMSS